MHLLPYCLHSSDNFDKYIRFEVIIRVCLIVFRVVILVYVVFYVNSVFRFPHWLVLVTGKMHGRLWSLPFMHITISCVSTIDICYSLLLFSKLVPLACCSHATSTYHTIHNCGYSIPVFITTLLLLLLHPLLS
jgi:hypothetical protein